MVDVGPGTGPRGPFGGSPPTHSRARPSSLVVIESKQDRISLIIYLFYSSSCNIRIIIMESQLRASHH